MGAGRKGGGGSWTLPRYRGSRQDKNEPFIVLCLWRKNMYKRPAWQEGGRTTHEQLKASTLQANTHTIWRTSQVNLPYILGWSWNLPYNTGSPSNDLQKSRWVKIWLLQKQISRSCTIRHQKTHIYPTLRQPFNWYKICTVQYTMITPSDPPGILAKIVSPFKKGGDLADRQNVNVSCRHDQHQIYGTLSPNVSWFMEISCNRKQALHLAQNDWLYTRQGGAPTLMVAASSHMKENFNHVWKINSCHFSERKPL